MKTLEALRKFLFSLSKQNKRRKENLLIDFRFAGFDVRNK